MVTVNCSRLLSEDHIDPKLVHGFLRNVKSVLFKKVQERRPDTYLYHKLKLVKEVGDKIIGSEMVPHLVPRNVALLFFNQKPHDFFPGAKIEIAVFTNGKKIGKKKNVTGPIDQQISNTLSFIKKNTLENAYPAKAIQEAVVNAVLHRGYENSASNPVKISIRPSGIEIVSYPGPNSNLTIEHLSGQYKVPKVPMRNQRTAEFLVRLGWAEGFGTGIETIFDVMGENGNPNPSFEFKSDYFQVHLPSCTEYTTSPEPSEQDNDNKDNSGDGDDEIESSEDMEEGGGNGEDDNEGGGNFPHGNQYGDVEHNAYHFVSSAHITPDLEATANLKMSYPIQESCGVSILLNSDHLRML